jgi:MerR family transcriptional regulator, light-induced transcriptional regulator
MNALHTIAAEMLEASATGYAAAANALLQRAAPGAVPEALDAATWKTHLVQRILELAAAVRVEQPRLFARRITWLRRALLARGADEQDLRRALLCLRTALQQELPPHLQPSIAPALDLAVSALDETLDPDPTALDGTKPTDRLALQYLATCLEGHPQRAIRLVLTELDRGLAPTVAYAQVLIAAQKEIGQLWHVGDVSIAEEHLVSETTRELMALIAAKHAPQADIGRTLVAAAVAGNAHDLGLRAVTDLFRIAGWRCLFLGPDVPAAEIARAADTFDAHLVVLNATLATQLKPLGEAIDTIRALAPGRKILVGGLAFDGTPELWRQLGADAHAATVDSAVALGNALVETPRR